MRASSKISRGRRGAALGLLVTLLLGAVGTAPARAAAPFNPTLTASITEDAARAATGFRLQVLQADGEEQIGDLSLSIPRDPGFMLDTNLPGNGGQIGTIRVVLYTNPRPGTLTVDGTLNDNNDRPGCGPGSVPARQCIIARLNVAGVQIEADLEVYEDTVGEYRISADLTETWASDEATTPDLRLKELSTSLVAKVGTHTVVRNPGTAASWPLTYSMTSATVPRRGFEGGLHPTCGAVCDVPLTTREYPPSVPAQLAPGHNSVHLSTQQIDFVWYPSIDRNEDPVTYSLEIQGQPSITVAAPTTNALTTLPPGTYNWRVTATANGQTTSTGVGTVIVIDPAGTNTYRFRSATNSDLLYVDPVQNVFVHQQASGALNGARAASATVDRGYIVVTVGFTLTVAYDNTLGSAAGAFSKGSQQRPFLDPPG